jgi:anti-sigma regulatory factor (Ser/Thr protein kinase)
VLLVQTELSNGPNAAREARREIAGVAPALPSDVVDDVTLLVSELVTNSFRHSGRREGDPINLRVDLTGSTVRIEVSDHGDVSTPAIRDPGDDGGWGLRIVERVADRWGTDEIPGGRVVWFEVEAVT